MAKNVIAQVVGGEKKVLDNVQCVKDVKRMLDCQGFTATVNGYTSEDSDVLEEGDFVSLAKPAKAGL